MKSPKKLIYIAAIIATPVASFAYTGDTNNFNNPVKLVTVHYYDGAAESSALI